jgi:aspartate/methionine/tyrosine aminotransferase
MRFRTITASAIAWRYLPPASSLRPALRALGFSIPVTPEGAFYIYAGIERFAPDSGKFALDVLEEAGVAITPGKDFGINQAERYVRFAYTRSLDDLQEGVRRLRNILAGC